MSTYLKYWLAAVHAEDITPRQILKCLSVFDDIKQLITATPKQWFECGLTTAQIKSLKKINWSQVDTTIAWAQQEGCHIVSLDDSDYPSLLKEISDPPLVLFVKGDKRLLAHEQIAMVGARRVSDYGKQNAYQFAKVLTQSGFVVTSGMALGVDAASHQGALDAQGVTIAVMGTGLNCVYPARHKLLASEIIEQGGALVSEFPLSCGPKSHHFPRRNRIISGLSRGVLVVEAAVKSGSLITARHAVEQGRDVFAIPGSIHAPLARGCHALIASGAKLVESADDILEEFEGIYNDNQVEFFQTLAIIPEPLSIYEQKIYEQVGGRVTPMDEIILRSGLTASEVSSILLSLELHGHIQSVSGGYKR